MSGLQHYQLRGTRVKPRSPTDVDQAAQAFYGIARLTGRKRAKRFDLLFEELAQYGITVSVVSDDDWENMTHGLTEGHFDPSTMTISVPESVYLLACRGDRDSLAVMFHELGHVLLGHKPVLHHSHSLPTRGEDSEWQADQFAETLLQCFGYDTAQLSLFEFMK